MYVKRYFFAMRGISSIRSNDLREPAVGASRYVREGELRPGASRTEAALQKVGTVSAVIRFEWSMLY